VSIYLDASVLVAIFIKDPFSARADGFLASNTRPLFLSDFAAAELASAVARLVRMSELQIEGARAAFSNFDAWASRIGPRLQTEASDVVRAEGFLRRLDLNLRAPDAINIAMAQRLGLSLATFVERMLAAAQRLGVETAQL
jgi:predicted nucleic acid-binding protein